MKSRIALIILLMPAYAAAAPLMQPGMWSLTVTVLGDGTRTPMPAVTQCVSQQDIDDETRTLPRPNGACTLSNVKRTDDSATYDLACINGAMQAQGRADVHFAADRYNGSVIMAMTEHGTGAKMTAFTIDAHRTGDCNK
jgi:hypothetical protein